MSTGAACQHTGALVRQRGSGPEGATWRVTGWRGGAVDEVLGAAREGREGAPRAMVGRAARCPWGGADQRDRVTRKARDAMASPDTRNDQTAGTTAGAGAGKEIVGGERWACGIWEAKWTGAGGWERRKCVQRAMGNDTKSTMCTREARKGDRTARGQPTE